jgi:cellobiose phosphorylase
MLNPIAHAAIPTALQKYKKEPYVVTADVYGAEPYTGLGGW